MDNIKIRLLLFAIVGTLFLTEAYAQTTNSDSPVYRYREYMKVEPGMEVDYIKLEKTWKKVHNKRKQEKNILEWELYRRIFPSGTNAEYDYMTVTSFASGEKYRTGNAMTWDYIVQMMDQSDMGIMENTDSIRKIVNRCMDVTLEHTQANGPFLQITRLQVNPGQDEQLQNMEAMMKPVFTEAARMGKIASWRFGKRLYPLTPETGSYYRVISTNSLDDMFTLDSSGYLETAFKKVYPTKSFAATLASFQNMVTILDVELWEGMDKTR